MVQGKEIFGHESICRQKIFSAFLEGVISNEKIAISENSILLIRYSLTEDLRKFKSMQMPCLKNKIMAKE